MSYTSDEVMVQPYEEVVDNPHYNSSSSSPVDVAEEAGPWLRHSKGPIVKSSRGVEITAQTGSVVSAPRPALGGSCSLVGEPRFQAKADVATLYHV